MNLFRVVIGILGVLVLLWGILGLWIGAALSSIFKLSTGDEMKFESLFAMFVLFGAGLLYMSITDFTTKNRQTSLIIISIIFSIISFYIGIMNAVNDKQHHETIGAGSGLLIAMGCILVIIPAVLVFRAKRDKGEIVNGE